MPPQRRLIPVGSAEARPLGGGLDIGAFAQSGKEPGAPVEIGDNGISSSGCGCRVAGESGDAPGWLSLGSLAMLVVARRRRQRR
jgi:MYXO-CTERM domain-containing protein